jgi:hypothetical protein
MRYALVDSTSLTSIPDILVILSHDSHVFSVHAAVALVLSTAVMGHLTIGLLVFDGLDTVYMVFSKQQEWCRHPAFVKIDNFFGIFLGSVLGW